MQHPTQGAPAPIVYAFTSTDLRVILIDGEIWFAATDVAVALGYRMASDMTRNLDDDEKGTHTMRTQGGSQEVSVINESGLYCCILKSRKPEAKKFKRWVTHEVLPTIRKTGSYGTPNWPPSDRASYQLREQLAAAIRSVTVGFQGKGASYAINERIRNHFGVRRVEDLTTNQARDAIHMVEQLREPTLKWVRAMRKLEKD